MMAFIFRLLLIACMAVVTAACLSLAFQFPAVGIVVLAIAAWRNRFGWRGSGYAYGSARLSSLLDLMRAKMLGGKGLLLGRASLAEPPSRWTALRCLLWPGIRARAAITIFMAAFWRRSNRRFILIKDFVHLLTVAPPGAGKSTAVLIPNLLRYIGSCVVVDPKAELYHATAEHRRKVMGHQIFRLDPFNVAGPLAPPSDTLNPLDYIAANEDLVDEVKPLADSLVVRQGTEPDPHWNESAILVFSAFIAVVCGCETDATRRNLSSVRDILASREVYDEVLKEMRKSTLLSGVIAQFGELLGWLIDRELGSVISSVHRHTSWMDGIPVRQSLATSSFDPRLLLGGKVTIYLILPHDKLTTHAGLMRLWLGTLMRLIANYGMGEKSPVLFLIDEAGHLGRMQVLQDSLTLMRGYGIRIWLFLQSLDQLKTSYGDQAPIILSSVSVQQYFGTLSYETADYLSKRIGDLSLVINGFNRGESWSRPKGHGGGQSGGSVTVNTGTNYSEISRRMYKPEEILVMPSWLGLAFVKNLPPIATELVHYYQAPEFKGRRGGRERGNGLAAAATVVLMVLTSSVVGLFALALRMAPDPQEVDPRLARPAAGRQAPSNGRTGYYGSPARSGYRAAPRQYPPSYRYGTSPQPFQTWDGYSWW